MAKQENIATKGVAFNMNDPDQSKLFEYAAKRPNFSGYIKRLIQRDMEGIYVSSPVSQKEEPIAINERLMENLI